MSEEQNDGPSQAELQRQAEWLATGRLFHTLGSDPRYRRKVLGLIKEASPETPIPEIDIPDSVSRHVEDRTKSQGEEFNKLNSRFDDLERHLSRENFRAEHDLSDAELVEVEEIARSGKISDGKTAVEYWKMRNQIGTPRGTRKLDSDTQDYLSRISKVSPKDNRSLKALAVEEANKVLSQMKRTRR